MHLKVCAQRRHERSSKRITVGCLVSHAGPIGLDLNPTHGTSIAGAVQASVVPTREERLATGIGILRTRDRREAKRLEETTQAANAANQGREGRVGVLC